MGELRSGKEQAATISPAIRFRFEELASRICDEAKVEFVDRPFRIREWTIQLEHRFREIDALGKTTDEATAELVLTIFGPAENIIKTLLGGLKGLWHRLRYYHRYAIHRFLAPVVFCLFHIELRSTGSLEIHLLATKDFQWRAVMFGWDYYIPIYIILATIGTRWITRTLRIPALIGQLTAMAVTTGLFIHLAAEWLVSVQHVFTDWDKGPRMDNVPIWENTTFGVFLLTCYVLEAVLFFFVLFLAAAEIFDLPARKRARDKALADGKAPTR